MCLTSVGMTPVNNPMVCIYNALNHIILLNEYVQSQRYSSLSTTPYINPPVSPFPSNPNFQIFHFHSSIFHQFFTSHTFHFDHSFVNHYYPSFLSQPSLSPICSHHSELLRERSPASSRGDQILCHESRSEVHIRKQEVPRPTCKILLVVV